MGTIVGTRSPLFYKSVRGGLPAVLDTSKYTGNIFFVDSNAAGASDTAGYGWGPDNPFATIDYAIGQCTANQGDVILVLPGHAETLAAEIAVDKAGISIIGLGKGSAAPQLTVNFVGDGINISTASALIENLLFNEATAAATSNINVAAANAIIRGVRMDQGVNDVDAITVTAAGELFTAEDCTVFVTANGPDCWIKFEGVVDRPIIRRNDVLGSDGTNAYDDGVFDFFGQAVTNPLIYDNRFGDGNVALTVVADAAAVVGEVIGPNSYAALATNADNTGVTLASFAADSITAAAIAANAIDAGSIAADAITAAKIAAGAIDIATFAADCLTGGFLKANVESVTANAIAAAAINADAITNAKVADNTLAAEQFALSAGEKTTDGVVVTRATAALPQTTSVAIFTVTGLVLLKRIVGYVTTGVGAVANATKLKANPTGVGATTDLCSTVDVNNAVAASYFQITGTFANAMIKTVDIPIAKQQAAEIVISPGTIEVDCAGNDGGGGRVSWSVTYVPLEAGAGIVAA